MPARFACPCLVAVLLVSSGLRAADTDGDGLLDALDVSRYDTSASPTLVLNSLGIQDLDGLNQLSPDLRSLYVGDNQITEIEVGDLMGLNTQYLYFYINQITEIEPYAFAGLTLRDLNLNNNHFSALHLEGATFEGLYHLGIDRFDVTELYLDDAKVSQSSYEEIAAETTEITDLSLTGMTFLGTPPESLRDILSPESLRQVTVDRELYDSFAQDFDDFAAIDGNRLSVVELPTDLFADCNANRQLDFHDLGCVATIAERDAVLTELGLRAGDLDGDGTVVFVDFLAFVANFGKPSGSYLEGNLNLAGNIGYSDFLILAGNFGTGATGAQVAGEPVPEPDAAPLLALGAVVSCICRRSRRFRRSVPCGAVVPHRRPRTPAEVDRDAAR